MTCCSFSSSAEAGEFASEMKRETTVGEEKGKVPTRPTTIITTTAASTTSAARTTSTAPTTKTTARTTTTTAATPPPPLVGADINATGNNRTDYYDEDDKEDKLRRQLRRQRRLQPMMKGSEMVSGTTKGVDEEDEEEEELRALDFDSLLQTPTSTKEAQPPPLLSRQLPPTMDHLFCRSASGRNDCCGGVDDDGDGDGGDTPTKMPFLCRSWCVGSQHNRCLFAPQQLHKQMHLARQLSLSLIGEGGNGSGRFGDHEAGLSSGHPSPTSYLFSNIYSNSSNNNNNNNHSRVNSISSSLHLNVISSFPCDSPYEEACRIWVSVDHHPTCPSKLVITRRVAEALTALRVALPADHRCHSRCNHTDILPSFYECGLNHNIPEVVQAHGTWESCPGAHRRGDDDSEEDFQEEG